ncbi:MAG: toxin-antitoxin system toxin subunit [Actinobacteria bacterium]|nr:toxin-antitoxin system toxin subunit [Actinomycetota bacterium]
MRQRDLNTDPPRWGAIGFDEVARVVELVAVALLNGDVLIIHANYLTAGFEQELRKE